MKDKKIGVSKIVINIGDKEAVLTVEQAKELRDALNAVLGEKVVERVVERDSHPWHGYYPYVMPYIRYWTVYAGDQSTYGNISTSGTYTITMNSGDGDLLPV